MKSFQFILMLLLIFGANIYVFYRLVYMLPPVLWARGIVAGIGAFVMLCFFGSFFGINVLPSAMLSAMYKIGTSWFFISIYFALAFLLMDILRAVTPLPIGHILYKNLMSFGVLVGTIAVLFIIGRCNYAHKERVELNIALSKDAFAQKPLKVVMWSDLHLGYGIGKKELLQWVELINQEHPDIVLFCGDVIDNSVRPLREQNMAAVFAQIKSTYGVYAVLGNHEYISGIEQSLEFLKEAGVQVVRDGAELVDDRFYVVGRDDRMSRVRKPIWELTDPLDKSKPIILLDHQPYRLEDVPAHGVDLQLSGHTHKGQVWPITWMVNGMYELAHGYLKKENTHFYVSSGIGLWGGKFRLGSRSEYVVINLTHN